MPRPRHAQFDVVIPPARVGQNPVNVVAEIALHFQHQRRRPLLRIARLPAEKLLGEGVHTGRGLAAPHGSENGHTGVESALRDGEPGGIENLPRHDRMMHLADHDSGGRLARIEGPRRESSERG